MRTTPSAFLDSSGPLSWTTVPTTCAAQPAPAAPHSASNSSPWSRARTTREFFGCDMIISSKFRERSVRQSQAQVQAAGVVAAGVAGADHVAEVELQVDV